MIDTNLLKEYIYEILGAIFEVHKELGPGLNEYVYQEGFEMELQRRLIPFEREVSFHPFYKGVEMKSLFRLDFLVKGDVVVELKAISELCDDNRAQLFNYMRLCNATAGILINFAPKTCCIERYFYDRVSKQILRTDGRPISHFRKLS